MASGSRRRADVAEGAAQDLGVLGQRGEHAVAVREVDCEHLRAVGGGPAELRGRGLGADAAPDEDGVDPEAAQDRRQVRDVPEGVRRVADHHRPAVRARRADAGHQVADVRLAADEELVRQHVAGAGEQAPVAHEPLDVGAALRADLEVVVQRHRLAVEDEVAVVRVAVEEVEEGVHHADEARAEGLEGQVPLAVPVGVGDDDEGAVRAGLALIRSRPDAPLATHVARDQLLDYLLPCHQRKRQLDRSLG